MTTLYARRGNRYHAVHDTAAFEGLPNGSWLVVVKHGHRAIRRAVGSDAELARIAASVRLADVIADAIVEHSRCQPSSRAWTEKEQRAWQAWKAVMGDDACLSMTPPSAREIGEAVAAEVLGMVESNDA